MQLSILLQLTALAIVHAAPNNNHAKPWNWSGYDHSHLIAHTSNGPILGHIAPNRSSVVEYLGIPYAAPPVGELRFAAPQAYAGHGFQDASTWVA